MQPANDPDTSRPTSGSGGSTCLKIGGIGCGILILLLLIGGYVFYTRGASMARSAIAAMIQKGTAAALDDIDLPDVERQAIMNPVDAFADAIRSGHVSVNQGLQVMERLLAPPVLGVIGTRVFLHRHIQASPLADAERDAAERTVRRYANGLVTDAIPESNLKALLAIVSEQTVDAHGRSQTHLKASLTPGELDAALGLMDTAVEGAGIPADVGDVDLSRMIETLIQEGVEEGAKMDSAAASPSRRRVG